MKGVDSCNFTYAVVRFKKVTKMQASIKLLDLLTCFITYWTPPPPHILHFQVLNDIKGVKFLSQA